MHHTVFCFRHTTYTYSQSPTQTHTHYMHVNTTAHTRQEEREKERRECCSTTYAMHVCVCSELRATEAAGIWWSSPVQDFTSEVTDFGCIRPPDGVSCGSSAVFPPTCSLGTLLTFQWQGCLFLPQMQALPNRHAPQGHPGQRTPTGGPSTHHQFPNHQTAPPHNHHIVPYYSVPAVTSNAQRHHNLSSTGPRPAPMQHQTLPPAPQFQIPPTPPCQAQRLVCLEVHNSS